MKQPFAFTESEDVSVLPPQIRHASAIYATLGCAIAFVALFVCVMSDSFTRGRICDLCPEDATTLGSIEKSGVFVRDAAIPCTFAPHIVVEVRWQSDRKSYCVHLIELRSVDIASLAPYFSHFVALDTIVPLNYPEADRIAIARMFPSLNVVSTR